MSPHVDAQVLRVLPARVAASAEDNADPLMTMTDIAAALGSLTSAVDTLITRHDGVLEAEARQAVRQELRDRCTRLLAWRFGRLDDATRPPSGAPELDGLRSLPRVPLRPQGDRPLYADERLVNEPGGRV